MNLALTSDLGIIPVLVIFFSLSLSLYKISAFKREMNEKMTIARN